MRIYEEFLRDIDLERSGEDARIRRITIDIDESGRWTCEATVCDEEERDLCTVPVEVDSLDIRFPGIPLSLWKEALPNLFRRTAEILKEREEPRG